MVKLIWNSFLELCEWLHNHRKLAVLPDNQRRKAPMSDTTILVKRWPIRLDLINVNSLIGTQSSKQLGIG